MKREMQKRSFVCYCEKWATCIFNHGYKSNESMSNIFFNHKKKTAQFSLDRL